MAINSAQPEDLLPRDSLAVAPFPTDSHNTCALLHCPPSIGRNHHHKRSHYWEMSLTQKSCQKTHSAQTNYSAETIFHTHIVELIFFFPTQACWMLPCRVHATLRAALITAQSPCWVSVGEKRYEANMAPKGWGCCAFWRFGSFVS